MNLKKITNVKIRLSETAKKICIEDWHLLHSHQILKILENQELLNAVIKDAKYVKMKFTMSNGQVWEICRETDCH